MVIKLGNGREKIVYGVLFLFLLLILDYILLNGNTIKMLPGATEMIVPG